MRLQLVLPALVVTACGTLAAAAAAQGAREPDVLAALLTEVRGLRQAMEQMASAGPRVQLALGRLQLQEQRLNTAIRRLEGVRDSTAAAERAVAQAQSDVARRQEAQAGADINAADARALAFEMAEMKRRLALAQQELQRWQAEEAQLQQQIAGEQGRWSEINRALEELERALGKR